ncbi:hypothetical protein CR969_02565 [Candidatus Saccharibacteria bacterium]|nr:MAG: hypothetical protein CR969_02565 [Candidatus Saccharibacteria bacterium]
MEQIVNQIAQIVGPTLDLIGIICILVGFVLASIKVIRQLIQPKREDGHSLFRYYRQSLARAILIGLEFLVAGDIIRTVAGDITLYNIATLGGIVVIRIVLGITLEAEIDPKKKFWRR